LDVGTYFSSKSTVGLSKATVILGFTMFQLDSWLNIFIIVKII